MALLTFLLALIVSIGIIGGYEYFKVIIASKYNPETMPLNYEILGSGVTNLILIHGLTGSLKYWKKDLESISKTHKLLLIDLLGFGDSPKPNSDYSLTVQLKAIEKIIKKEGFNDGESIVGGHSMGAIISLALLEKHSNWFKSGVFISIPVYKNADEFRQIMSTHSFIDRISSSKYSKYICMFHHLLMTKQFKPDNLPDDIFEEAKKHTWQSYYYSLNELVLKTDLFTIASGIKAKDVLFIHGKKDSTAPFYNIKKLTSVFQNAKVVTSSDGDHQFFLKETGFVWQTIQGFSSSLNNIKNKAQ